MISCLSLEAQIRIKPKCKRISRVPHVDNSRSLHKLALKNWDMQRLRSRRECEEMRHIRRVFANQCRRGSRRRMEKRVVLPHVQSAPQLGCGASKNRPPKEKNKCCSFSTAACCPPSKHDRSMRALRGESVKTLRNASRRRKCCRTT